MKRIILIAIFLTVSCINTFACDKNCYPNHQAENKMLFISFIDTCMEGIDCYTTVRIIYKGHDDYFLIPDSGELEIKLPYDTKQYFSTYDYKYSIYVSGCYIKIIDLSKIVSPF